MFFDDYRITAEPNSVPAILAQPKSASVNQSDRVVFGVAARGTEPISYQWKFNGRNLTGETNAVFVINRALPANSGAYSVDVRNQFGSATSDGATLSVTAPVTAAFLEITAGPLSSDGRFTLTVNSTPGLAYSIEVSTDLTNWTEVASGVNTSGVFSYTDPDTQSFSSRFFRARQSP